MLTVSLFMELKNAVNIILSVIVRTCNLWQESIKTCRVSPNKDDLKSYNIYTIKSDYYCVGSSVSNLMAQRAT